jgi:hypothetical protein
MTREQKFISAIGLALFAAAVALALSGYLHPAMLIDFANLRICS